MLSLMSTFYYGINSSAIIAFAAGYNKPIFKRLAYAENECKFTKMRVTQKAIDGKYIDYVEVYIDVTTLNNFFVYLHNQSIVSETEIRFQTVPFLPAEEGTEVVGAEQEL